MEQKTCPDCSASFQGNFCPNCGQKYLVTPFTFKFIASNAIQLLDFNKGFFLTLTHAILKPGELIHSYLKGKTRRYNNPIRFLLTLIALMAILDALRTSGGKEEITVLIVMPAVFGLAILTTIFNYFAFRNSWKLTEHVIVSLYFSSAIFIVLSFVTFLFLAAETYEILPYSDKLAAGVYIPLFSIFVFRFHFQVFSGGSLGRFLKSLFFQLIIPGVFIGCVYLIMSL